MYNYNHIHKHYHNHKLISHLPPYHLSLPTRSACICKKRLFNNLFGQS